MNYRDMHNEGDEEKNLGWRKAGRKTDMQAERLYILFQHINCGDTAIWQYNALISTACGRFCAHFRGKLVSGYTFNFFTYNITNTVSYHVSLSYHYEVYENRNSIAAQNINIVCNI